MAKRDEILDAVISSDEGRKLDANGIFERIKNDDDIVVDKNDDKTPIVRQQGSAEFSEKEIEKCKTIKELFDLVDNEVVDLNKDENKKAFLKKVEEIVEDKEYILSRGCSILGLEVKDTDSLLNVLEGIKWVRSLGRHNNIKIVVEDDSCLDLLYDGDQCRFNDYKDEFIEYKDLSSVGKILVEGEGTKFNIKIGDNELVIGMDEVYKLIHVLYSLGSVSGRDNFFEKKISVDYDNAKKGMCLILGREVDILNKDYGVGCEHIRLCRECGMFDSVLNGVIVSSDATDTKLNDDEPGSFIMGIDIKSLGIGSNLDVGEKVGDVAVDFFKTLLGSEDVKWDESDDTVIVNCPNNNKIQLS